LTRYIQVGNILAPPETMAGGMRMRLWSESDIERLKEALPRNRQRQKAAVQKETALSNPGKHGTGQPKRNERRIPKRSNANHGQS